jgi:hypothetical protein
MDVMRVVVATTAMMGLSRDSPSHFRLSSGGTAPAISAAITDGSVVEPRWFIFHGIAVIGGKRKSEDIASWEIAQPQRKLS